MVRDLFARYAGTEDSLSNLAAWARDRGVRSRYGKPMSKAVIHTILQNPVYVGRFRRGGRVYDGTHEPLIDASLFAAVQEKLHGRGAPKRVRMEFPYRGLVTCRYCGCQLTARLKKGRYVYYHCTHNHGPCEQRSWSQDSLSEALVSVLEPLRMSNDVAEQLMDFVLGSTEERRRDRVARRMALKAEEKAEIEHMDVMYADRVDGRITEEQWVRRDAQQSGRLAMVRDEIARLAADDDFNPQAVRTVVELVKRLPEAYRGQSHEERARLLRAVCSNCTIKADRVDPVYKEPFAGIVQWQACPSWLPG